MLKYQKVEIPADGGINEKMSEKLVPPGEFLEIENGEFVQEGAIVKRWGTEDVGSTVEYIKDRRWHPFEGARISSLNDTCVVTTAPGDVLVETATPGEWVDCGNTSPGTLDRRVGLWADDVVLAHDMVFNEHSGLLVHARSVMRRSNDGYLIYSIIEPDSQVVLKEGWIIQGDDALSNMRLRVVTAGKYVGIFYEYSPSFHIKYSRVDMDTLDVSDSGLSYAINGCLVTWDAYGYMKETEPIFAVATFSDIIEEDLVYSFNADLGVTATVDDEVTEWLDQHTAGPYDLTNTDPTFATCPKVVAGAGPSGGAVIRFDALAHCVWWAAGPAVGNTGTVYLVLKKNAESPFPFDRRLNEATISSTRLAAGTKADGTDGSGGFLTSAPAYKAKSAIAQGTWYIVRFRWSSSGMTVKLMVKGAAEASGSSFPTHWAGGAANLFDRFGLACGCDIAAMWMYSVDQADTPAESCLFDWISAHLGVT